MQGFTRVKTSMTESATVMREMGKRASDISSIVDTINLIAERTNLLSLNASIEAARQEMPARLCGGGGGDPEPCRSVGQGNVRHRGHHQGTAGGRREASTRLTKG
jgi:hypothetical protein